MSTAKLYIKGYDDIEKKKNAKKNEFLFLFQLEISRIMINKTVNMDM
jgi:hypothetical protein